MTLAFTISETLKWLLSLPILLQESLCFIRFQLERQTRVQANELCIIVLLLFFKFIMFYHILFHLT